MDNYEKTCELRKEIENDFKEFSGLHFNVLVGREMSKESYNKYQQLKNKFNNWLNNDYDLFDKIVPELKHEANQLALKIRQIRENNDYGTYKNLIQALTQVLSLIKEYDEDTMLISDVLEFYTSDLKECLNELEDARGKLISDNLEAIDWNNGVNSTIDLVKQIVQSTLDIRIDEGF